MKKLRRRVEKFNGLCVGLDLHKRFIQMSVIDHHGDEVEADRFASDRDLLVGWLDRLAEPPCGGPSGGPSGGGRPLRVVIEASGCFVWVEELKSCHVTLDDSAIKKLRASLDQNLSEWLSNSFNSS
jgi:hypothetical protein